MHTQGVAAQVASARPARCAKPPADVNFGVALLDSRGNLLGASASSGLPGEVEVPSGTNLREQDLRSYFVGGRPAGRGRCFPLVSATWVQVRGRRVRVGIYMEKGDPAVSLDRLDLDLGAVAALIGSQLVA
jgi:hypothetical protein